MTCWYKTPLGKKKKFSLNSHNSEFIVTPRISTKIRMTCRKFQNMWLKTDKLPPGTSVQRVKELTLWTPLMVATHIWYRRNPNSYSVAADNILIIALKTCFLALLLLFGSSFWSCFSAVVFGPSVVLTHSASTALVSNPTSGLLNTDSWISLPTITPHPT